MSGFPQLPPGPALPNVQDPLVALSAAIKAAAGPLDPALRILTLLISGSAAAQALARRVALRWARRGLSAEARDALDALQDSADAEIREALGPWIRLLEEVLSRLRLAEGSLRWAVHELEARREALRLAAGFTAGLGEVLRSLGAVAAAVDVATRSDPPPP